MSRRKDIILFCESLLLSRASLRFFGMLWSSLSLTRFTHSLSRCSGHIFRIEFGAKTWLCVNFLLFSFLLVPIFLCPFILLFVTILISVYQQFSFMRTLVSSAGVCTNVSGFFIVYSFISLYTNVLFNLSFDKVNKCDETSTDS